VGRAPLQMFNGAAFGAVNRGKRRAGPGEAAGRRRSFTAAALLCAETLLY
jgi:hypothetical protein